MTKRGRIAELYAQGLSQNEIARVLGISKSLVSYHIKRLGYPSFPYVRHDWSVIQAFYDEGHTVRECREKFGFSGSAWTAAVHRGAVNARRIGMPVVELLKGKRNRTHLKGRLLKAGLKENRCEACGIEDWRGRPLAFELHHINGEGQDNRLENLALLCPNCHSQTDSWGGRNTRRAARNGSPPARARPPPALPSLGTT